MPEQEVSRVPKDRVDIQPKKTPTQQRSRQRVADILQATRSTLRKQGVTSLTTTRVAEEAGIPVSSLYQYFPNKTALLVAVYSAYLNDLRTLLEQFEREPRPPRDQWRDNLLGMLQRMARQEQRDAIDIELVKAVSLYPELRELDRKHANRVAEQMVRYFLDLGSSWPRKRLKRLMLFTYEINNAAWMARLTFAKGQTREIVEWEITAILALVEQCMEEPD
jgi:AcrR family transcriptional regulator